ncbi:MAG: hypothetical protein V7785_05600 [Bermanella sp.]
MHIAIKVMGPPCIIRFKDMSVEVSSGKNFINKYISSWYQYSDGIIISKIGIESIDNVAVTELLDG